jgi:hypothetical protein
MNNGDAQRWLERRVDREADFSAAAANAPPSVEMTKF